MAADQFVAAEGQNFQPAAFDPVVERQAWRRPYGGEVGKLGEHGPGSEQAPAVSCLRKSVAPLVRVIALAGQRDERAGIDEQQVHSAAAVLAGDGILDPSLGVARQVIRGAQRADEPGFAGQSRRGSFRGGAAAKRCSSNSMMTSDLLRRVSTQ
jgi:hypothetical protein